MNRIKSWITAAWFVLVSCAWLVPLTLAADRLLAYLNDDLARLHFKSAGAGAGGGLPGLFDINEAANITAARTLLYASIFLLGVAIFYWSIQAHRYFRAESDQVEGLRTRLATRERALEQQFRHLDAQIVRGRDTLALEYERLASSATPEAVATVFDARFERLENLLARHLSEMDQRLVTVEGELRTSGDKLAHQFVDLRDRVVQVQSVNNSNFGDLASAPMPLGGVAGSGARLQDLVLNLSHLQEDLRLERRQLRKKLQGLPDAGR